MKKTILMLTSAVLIFSGCGNSNNHGQVASPPSFTLSVTEDNSFHGLPELMSFVFGRKDNNWIMFSGRINGFHNFAGPGQYFPVNKANDSIFVYDEVAGQIYSMKVPQYGGDTGNVFISTNLEHTQQGEYLYACGGYGVAAATDSFASKTYSYFMRIQLTNAINAVKNHNPAAFKNSIKWGNNSMVAATGGELYKLADDKFYLAVGHNYTGRYLKPSAVQIYLDQVRVFTLTESVTDFTLVPAGVITDGLNDSVTQFRRRDLVVAPSVLADGNRIGLAIYGGVFTNINPSTTGISIPFHNPIYVDGLSYRVDSFAQWTNIYSSAFMSMYDSSSQSMMTSFFGGLGDSLNNANAFGNANWTNVINTNVRCFANNGDTTTLLINSSAIQGEHFRGAEAVFIPKANVPFYNSNYHILDYSRLENSQVVGYIYGGIESNACCNVNPGQTHASNKVLKVTLTKVQAGAASAH